MNKQNNTMPKLAGLNLPPMDQIGFVVRNLNEWVARYEPMFGPFHRIDGSVEGADYRGRREDASLEIAFGRSGELEIEFIEWRGGYSPHREFIESGKQGMHHVRFSVDDTDQWIERVASVGFKPIWYKRLSDDIVFSYLENDHDPLLIEFLQMPSGPYPAMQGRE